MSAPIEIRETDWERPPLVEPVADAELERWARQAGAPRIAPLRYFARCPWLARSAVELNRPALAHLDPELGDVAVLVVSRDNSCRYCYAGARFLLRLAGMSDARIESVESALVAAERDTPRHLALEFARRLSRCNPPPSDADVEGLLRAGFSREEILELAFVTAQYVYVNRITTFLALPPEHYESLDRPWLVGPMRLWHRSSLRARRRHRAGSTLSEEERRAPFASSVNRLDGLPGARNLRTVLDEAWSSPLLSRRAKALVFAVVARGLETGSIEREALELLYGEGFDRGLAESSLAHLADPALDRVESALLPFARETLWYEPAAIQRRARALRGGLRDDELLEAIGIASLANAVCRLALLPEAIA